MRPVAELTDVGLTVRGLSKGFGRTELFRELNLEFGAGETVLLLGPNGAGKSTLLRLFAELARPDGGTVERSPRGVSVGYVGHHLGLYRHLTVRENLRLIADLCGRERDEVAGIAARWALTESLDKPLGELSRGQQFRAALARALLPAPRLLLLDEPTASLDDRSVGVLRSELTRLVTGESPGLAIVATHDVARLRADASRVVVLAGGRVEFDSRGSSIEAALTVYQQVNR